MANNSKDISQVIKGMNFDFAPLHLTDGMYAFAQNAVVEDFDGNGFPVIQNEASNIKAADFPSGSTIVGYIEVPEQERIIWFLSYDDSGLSEIGETINPDNCRRYAHNTESGCDDCSLNLLETNPLETISQVPCSSYRTIQKDSCLGFSSKFPITGIYRLTDCTLQIIFVSENAPRRFLEFDYINDDPTQGLIIKSKFYQIIGFENPPCDNPIYGPNLNCNALNIQPNILTPCIDFIDLVGGGTNKAGSYQFFIAMSDVNGVKLSSYLSATNIIPIFTKQITTVTDYITDRSIKLSIKNLDPTGVFQYYNIAVAKTIDNVTSFYLAGTFPVTQTTFTYTGNNKSEISLSTEDIFGLYPYYENAGAVAQSNGFLFFANVNEYSKPNLQRIANNIILQWQTIAIPEEVYYDSKNTTNFRSAMRDEIYPYGIQFLYDTGEESNGYHIPGREGTEFDFQIIDNGDIIPSNSCSGISLVERWQVYNTGTLEGGDLSIYNGCDESCYQYGNFSYWESSEKYPNNPLIWGDLCGQNIRHHKFPDSTITHIHNLENADVDASGATFHRNNIVYPIGVKVDHDSVRNSIANAVIEGLITQTDADRIIGYRILRGNRFGNKSVIAKGLLYDVNRYQRVDGNTVLDQEPIYFANYPFNDLRSNPFLTNNFQNYSANNTPEGDDLPFDFSSRYTFHSPDTHFNQPGLGTELKLETVEYGQSQGFYNKCKDQAKEKLLSEFSYAAAFGVAIVEVLAETIPPAESTYTVKVGSNSFTGTAPLANATSGTTSGTSFPGNTSDTETFIPSVVQHFDPSTGILLPAATAGNSYTVSSNRGGFAQFANPAALDPINGPVPTAFYPLEVVAQGALGFLTLLAGFLEKIMTQMQIIIDLIKSIIPFRDWTVQYNSIGKYNEYVTVPNDMGVKRRLISAWDYLDDTNQFLNSQVNPITGDFDAIKFNNLNREDSVYLKYDGDAFPTAGDASGIEDQSRTRLSDGLFNCGLNIQKYTPISSYYASIKNYVPDQYGSIYNIQYLRTGSCAFGMDAQNSGCTGVYGGDTFISRFALKIKVPYFLATTFKLPNGTDYDYSSVTNLAFPRFYFNTTPTIGSNINNIGDLLNPFADLLALYNLFGGPNSIRDCAGSSWFDQSGYIYLYHYGIPYFFAESDYNVDYRYGTNNLEGDFYPHQGDLDFWLQEVNVPISEPNQYHYNNSYSKQNEETSISIDSPSFEPGRTCRVTHPNRIISSDSQNWFVFPANNFFDNPLTDGGIISIDGIENQTVLVRSENKTSIFKSILRQVVDGQTVQVGNGGVFANPPQDFGTTTLGYIGTQNKAILHTEYGHITVDAKRGQIFNIATGASGVEEISKNGMKNWFKENLPFRLLRDFPNMPVSDIDNNFIGSGLIMSFDKRFNRFLLTKLDWKKTNSSVLYDPELKQFYIIVNNERVVITLGNPNYFKDCSWTISYNFWTQSWVSFHSYKPNYYIDFIDFFSSGINSNNSSYWVHGLYNGSYQVYYGNLYPFIVEPIIKFQEQLKILGSIEFDTEVRRYSNESDYTIKRDIPGFNKAIIYNDLYNSGLVNIIKTNKNDFSQVTKYPVKGFASWDIETSIADYKWRINQFYALNKDHSEVPFWLYKGNNADKILNNNAFNYMKNDYNLSRLRGQWFKTRFINDKLSNYKIMYKFQLNDQTLQYR